MSSIGLFYGSDTGRTEEAAQLVEQALAPITVETIEIFEATAADFEKYDKIILGLSTWHDGKLQSDWETFFETFSQITFDQKTVAIFGLGDQIGYAEYFIDGVGILAQVVLQNNGHLVGLWPTEGYTYTASKAEYEQEWFLGLALDFENQKVLSKKRIITWVEQLKNEGFDDYNQ